VDEPKGVVEDMEFEEEPKAKSVEAKSTNRKPGMFYCYGSSQGLSILTVNLPLIVNKAPPSARPKQAMDLENQRCTVVEDSKLESTWV
jgi:hypothetical protein